MATYTIEQYNALKDAIAQGVKKVKYFDKEVEYNSISDTLRALELMKRELFPDKNNDRKYASFSKGVKPGCRKYRRGQW